MHLDLSVFCVGHLSMLSFFLSLNDRRHQFQQPCDPNQMQMPTASERVNGWMGNILREELF